MFSHNDRFVCPNCFASFTTDSPFCPACGYSNADPDRVPVALPVGTILYGKYMVGKVLGKGGFGITYLGYNLFTYEKVAIKEYLPDTLSYRSTGNTGVSSYPGEKGNAYKLGAEKFYEEAQTVSRFNGHPNIVRVWEFFYENNTAYFVMEYVQGADLKAYVEAHGGSLGEKPTLDFMLPVMDALIVVHGVGVLHRDISPDNIFVSDTGEVKLLDFGSARQVLGEQSKSLSVILKHGFAPIEQYQTRGKQGPWTDVYALGATIYFCLTGKIPEPAMDRIDGDDLVPPSKLGVPVSPQFEAVLLKALSVKAAGRFQSVAEFKQALTPESYFAQEAVPPPAAFLPDRPAEAADAGIPDSVKKTKEERDAAAPFIPARDSAHAEEGASDRKPYDPSHSVAEAHKNPVPAKKKRVFFFAAAVVVFAFLVFGVWRLFGTAFLPASGDDSSLAQGGGAQSGASNGTSATQKPALPASATPASTELISASPTLGWGNSESPAATLAAAPTPTVTPKPTATHTAKPTSTPAPKPTLTPSVKPTTAATATPKPTSSAAATQSPAASSTPKPTSVPTPKPTPTPAVSYYMDVSPSSLSIAVGEVVEMPSVSTNCSYVYTTGTSSIVGISRTSSGAIGYIGKTPGSFTLTYTGYADAAHTTALCSATVSVTVYQP